MQRGERLVFTGLVALSTVLRALSYFTYRFDSDEPQHLHVAWGWTAGLLQYRDLFDNHAPLFHIISAPLLGALGERADVLRFMRAPMLLLFAVVLAATYVLGRRLYSHRVGAWATVMVSLLPPFFLKTLEYRTDNLWNTLWFVALIVLTGGAFTAPRAFLGGLFLGLAFATSMKTSLLIISLGAAGLMTLRAEARRHIGSIVAFLLGVFIPPSIVVAYFAHRGAVDNLVYCVVTFNEIVAHTRSAAVIWLPRMFWLPGLFVLIRIAWRNRDATPLRFFFAFWCGFFFLTLFSSWILISPRDYLVALPLLAIFAVAWVERTANNPAGVYLLTALAFALFIAHYDAWFTTEAQRERITMVRQTLGLTRPGEMVMDFKGETIYRRRPSYFIYEFITRNAMYRGLLQDTIAEDMVKARCYVVQADGDFFPQRSRAFLNANFVDVGRLRVAGHRIDHSGAFTIVVPGPYAIVGKTALATGILDGTPYTGPRELVAGPHTFRSSDWPLAYVWAPAIERGYSPFKLRYED